MEAPLLSGKHFVEADCPIGLNYGHVKMAGNEYGLLIGDLGSTLAGTLDIKERSEKKTSSL